MTDKENLENELAISCDVSYTVPEIHFPGYEQARKRAEEVADYISSVNLTEDNVPQVKKMLANARKLVAALDERRKEIKREVTAPVKEFEARLKDITGIIDSADSELRSQIRALEEKEREQKEEKLQQLWDLRIMHYSFGNYVPGAFRMWLEPQHLNKSTSIRAAEDDMTEFMERLEKDVVAILALPDSEEVMTEYAGTMNLADAIQAVKKRHEYQSQAFATEEKSAEETAVFVITGKANITLAEKLLAENGIVYERK